MRLPALLAAPFLVPALVLALLLGPFATASLAGPPADPRKLDFDALGKSVGKRGGTLRMLMAKPKDIRMMVVYGNARLVSYDQNFELVPDILAKVENEGNRTFTLHLREGHLWSDGQPFTSEDFRYWWEDVALNEALEPGGPDRQMLVDGKRPTFEVIDERTVRYSWDEPNPLFLTALAGARPLYIYMPAHYMKQFHEKYADKAALAAKVQAENVQGWVNLHQRFGRQYRPENPALPLLQPWVNTIAPPAERFVFVRNENFTASTPRARSCPISTAWSSTWPRPRSSPPRPGRASPTCRRATSPSPTTPSSSRAPTMAATTCGCGRRPRAPRWR